MSDDDFNELMADFNADPTGVFPDVPATPVFPRAPTGPVFPKAPILSATDRTAIIAQRKRLFDQYVELLRTTLNDVIRLCPIATNPKIKQNIDKINVLKNNLITIHRNLDGQVGGQHHRRKSQQRKKYIQRHSHTRNKTTKRERTRLAHK